MLKLQKGIHAITSTTPTTLLATIAGAAMLSLTGCAASDPSIAEHAGAYPDIYTYQIAEIHNSLKRHLFIAPPASIAKPEDRKNPYNLIVWGATPDTLQQAGFITSGDGYQAMHLQYGEAIATSPGIYNAFCTSHGGSFTDGQSQVTKGGVTSDTFFCTRGDDLTFVARVRIRPETPGVPTLAMYDTIKFSPPVAPARLTPDARKAVEAIGYALP